MRRHIMAAVALATALLGLQGGSALAQGQAQSCFYPNQWTSWKAPDDHTIYLLVGRRVFRLDLASSCPTLRVGATLITRNQSSQICSAIDWNLKVRSGGMAVGCIVSKMSQLTPDEIAALPPSARP
jgi:hypothetical protein